MKKEEEKKTSDPLVRFVEGGIPGGANNREICNS